MRKHQKMDQDGSMYGKGLVAFAVTTTLMLSCIGN